MKKQKKVYGAVLYFGIATLYMVLTCFGCGEKQNHESQGKVNIHGVATTIEMPVKTSELLSGADITKDMDRVIHVQIKDRDQDVFWLPLRAAIEFKLVDFVKGKDANWLEVPREPINREADLVCQQCGTNSYRVLSIEWTLANSQDIDSTETDSKESIPYKPNSESERLPAKEQVGGKAIKQAQPVASQMSLTGTLNDRFNVYSPFLIISLKEHSGCFYIRNREFVSWGGNELFGKKVTITYKKSRITFTSGLSGEDVTEDLELVTNLVKAE